MKNNILLSIIFALLISLNIFAQSDYEVVQGFKASVVQIEGLIKSAVSLEDAKSVMFEIESLKKDYSKHKDLLDKSLYPDDFNITVSKLNNLLELRKKDFTHIDVLQTEVVVLKDEVALLNKRNNELINQIVILESARKKDQETIKKLERLVADLRTSLLKRDNLVLSMVDSLTPKLMMDAATLSQDQKDKIYSEVEKNNVLFNIKRSLRDHERFLDITTLKPNDLDEVKVQQKEFAAMWRKIGVNLTAVYAAKGEKANELKDIDALFNTWQEAIRQEAWHSIKEEFAVNNINLQNFDSGKEFTVEVTRFIDDEIKNFGIKSKEDSEITYAMFADSTWFKSVNTEWIPYLINNKMLDEQQKDLIEAKIGSWKEVVYPRDLSWLYYVIGVALLAVVIFYLVRRKPKTAADVLNE